MIPIKQEAIDNFIAMQARTNAAEYTKEIAKQIQEENPALFKAIVGNVNSVCYNVAHAIADNTPSEQIQALVASNLILLSLAVYHTINIQLEANQLAEMYGEPDAPKTD